MFSRKLGRIALLAAVLSVVGCGPPGRVKQETIEVKAQVGLDRARQLLETYARGQPLGSEAMDFPALVEEVRKTDTERAAILEQGFAELQKPRVNTAAKARELLAKLAPKPGG